MHGLLKLSDGFVGFIILLCAVKFVIKAKKKLAWINIKSIMVSKTVPEEYIDLDAFYMIFNSLLKKKPFLFISKYVLGSCMETVSTKPCDGSYLYGASEGNKTEKHMGPHSSM